MRKELAEQISNFAKAKDRSESSIIRLAVNKFFEDQNEF